MKLYTRTGDDGTTGLFGGERVAKTHPRIEAYGTIDETNACIGLAATGTQDEQLAGILATLQSMLFDVGADLATPVDSPHAAKVRRMSSADVETIEGWIDTLTDATPPISSFVLPGGTQAAAHLHLARTVARRGERAIIELASETAIDPVMIHLVNRLSDFLFAAARYANHVAGVPDVPWQQTSS
ncbi:MAG: cob(I)yrinic acid a,c-diamide adenosyltransferase [Phycisphaerales bacterium]|nr:cob(I)yrinic acid a,c-diamide adenosyltransferase [Phycisphaerales bacterium]